MTEPTRPGPDDPNRTSSDKDRGRDATLISVEQRGRSRRQQAGSRPSSGRKRRSSTRHYDLPKTALWLRPWLPLWRRAKGFWDHWKPDRLSSGRPQSKAFVVDAVIKFKGSEFELERDDGRILVRTWPGTRTMCNPIWWINNAGQFAVRWLITRRYLALLLAAPATISALGLIGAISAGSTISAGAHSMLYKRILSVGIARVDMDQAALAVTALIRLDPTNTAAVFDRALIEEQAGNAETARHIMAELAHSASSTNAAMWLAQAVGDLSQFDDWSDQQKLTYHHWLQVASNSAPDNPVPRRLLGQVRALAGNKAGAYQVLLPIADLDLETSHLVYSLQRELGHTDLALARSEKLELAYKSTIEQNPLDLTTRIQYASLLASLERFAEARELLNQGLAYAPTAADRLQLTNAAGELLVSEAAQLAISDKSPRGLMQRMQRLKQAAEIAPQNRRVMEAVTEVCFEAAASNDIEMAMLRESLIQNVDPDTSHFILGTIALNQGKVVEATQHLELAAKNNPHMPGFLNNLAHAICYSDNPDLERALRLANAANELQPNHPHLCETRGQIYLKLKRYTDAIADLEIALQAEELRPQVRTALAEAYEALGQVEIAKRQRELANE